MFRDFFSTGFLFDLPLLAMGIFLAIFVAVLLRISQRARGAEYSHMANLPLQDDSVTERGNQS